MSAKWQKAAALEAFGLHAKGHRSLTVHLMLFVPDLCVLVGSHDQQQ
jgi:hypothetical protein